jgi:hypothetical protein
MQLPYLARRRLRTLALALAAGALAVPASASAATLTVDHGAHTAVYVAAAGEANSFSFYRLSSTYRVQDTGVAAVPLTEVGGTLCSQGEPWKYRCPASSIESASISLGDGADRFDASTSSVAVTLVAGADSKTISTGSGPDAIFARNGSADQITCGPGADSVESDVDDVVDPSCETVSPGTDTGASDGEPGQTDAGGDDSTGGGGGGDTSAPEGVFDTPVGLTVALTTVPVENHQARLRLACAADAPAACRGEVALLLPAKRKRADRSEVTAARGQYVAQQRRRRRIGRRSYRIAPGKSATVAVPILLRGHYQQVSRRRRSRVRLRITERDPAGKVIDVQTHTITLKIAKRGQR